MSSETPNTDIDDLRTVIEAAATERPLAPEVARRLREQGDEIRRRRVLATQGVQNIGVRIIRKHRGPLDEGQERELTLAQSDLLKKGELQLTDPDTGTVSVLVPEAEYKRLRGQ
jgi:hypothetical protein